MYDLTAVLKFIEVILKSLLIQDAVSEDETVDENIGKTVWIDTVGPKGKRFGWLPAAIELKTEDGDYVARYIERGKPSTKTALIQDLFNENHIRFFSSCYNDAWVMLHKT